MIKFQNIVKKFGNHVALQQLNLTIDKQDVIAIIGPSGSGKSTLLRCISNLETSSSGYIQINNIKLDKNNIAQVTEKVAMVFQNFNLFPHFTVLENLTYSAIKVQGLATQDAINKANKLLNQFGLQDKANYKPAKLSGGQKQRVAIARALMTDPEIILFDEPTSALDLEIIKDLIALIKNLAEQNITMLIVTHHIGFAKQIASKIIFMDQGYVLDYMPTADFFKQPNSARARLFLENIKNIE